MKLVVAFVLSFAACATAPRTTAPSLLTIPTSRSLGLVNHRAFTIDTATVMDTHVGLGPANCDWFVGGPRPDQLPITIGPQRLCGIGLRPGWPDDRR